MFGSFLYIFVGTFIGGGVVLGGSLYTGASGNAGSIGSDARAWGGAVLPLYSNFAPDRDVLLKLPVGATTERRFDDG